MPCDPIELKHVPLFSLLDDEELAVLAAVAIAIALAIPNVPDIGTIYVTVN